MSEKSHAHAVKKHEHVKLGEWFATAICGNDILSSCLYVSGIAAIYAGVYAPLVLLCVGAVLYLFRFIYTEVVEALPVNGGAYNCLLNGTSKTVAAVAGVMTILSYIATACISAKVGIEYLSLGVEHLAERMQYVQLENLAPYIMPGTIGILLIFAILVVNGLKDSAKVAFGIFVTHITTMLLVLIIGAIHAYTHGTAQFHENAIATGSIVKNAGGILMTIYLAFSASLLGVSGFESSANFVEEQKPGVFRKTLRNMWVGVTFFNPLMAIVALNTLPIAAISEKRDFMLASAGLTIGGEILLYLIAIDALLVLSGAVLTAYVGVGGLIQRMALDGCLPQILTKQNAKGSYPITVIAFFLLCSSILLVTGGDLLSLAGVYTIAFLGVMTLFGIGNLILKETRPELKRTYTAPILVVVIAFIATSFGILGNIRIDEKNLQFFEIYFIPSLLLVLMMVYKDYILSFLLRTTKDIPSINNYLRRQFDDMIKGTFVVFIRTPDRLYSILDYINRNETGWNIILVHCQDKEGYEEINKTLPMLKKAGFHPNFNIKSVFKNKPFGPEVIQEVAEEYHVHTNRILIGSIHSFHPYEYDEMGGVRIIFN
ncbi:hypothetical protein BH09PAT2_BH09PAT2_10670 [soil metagenome]